MSIVALRAAMEVALSGIAPAIATAWENKDFSPPPPSTPYQAAYLLPAPPVNSEFGKAYFASAIFQVSLFYPLNSGSSAAAARADLLCARFARGTSLQSNGITVVVDGTPEVGRGTPDEGRWFLPVKIRISAYIS